MPTPRPTDRIRRGTGGYTLLEVVIAVGILTLLGSGLATLLTQGISIWRRAENRGRVYDQARILLERMAEDIRSTVVLSSSAGGDAWVRFICDEDLLGRQRLRFVRTISAETSDAILRHGGKTLSLKSPAVYDGNNDSKEARHGRLGAPGGLMEVIYLRDPRLSESHLWRGFRSPVGGMRSLVNQEVPGEEKLAELSEVIAELEKRALGGAMTEKEQQEHLDREAQAVDDFEWNMSQMGRPLTDGVLFLGFSFWGPTTNTWDESEKPLELAGGSRPSGPLFHWDSTRAILNWTGGDSDEFMFRSIDGSLTDSSDDIFPEQVEITLVLRDDNSESFYLVDRISKSDDFFRVSKPFSLPENEADRYLLVGGEWMYMRAVDGTRVSIESYGRGRRGTEPTSHLAGDRVDLGATFRRVVEMPGSQKSRSSAEREPALDRRKEP
ncbi:MAG: type II secretion system protein [Planctomycetota bacterium]|nr:type II secretion system protein [Planctomycetota bacterium]